MNRYRADEATVTIAQQGNGGRLLVSWRSEHFHAILGSFREAVVRTHGDGVYLAAEKAWSVAPRARPRLEEWLARSFEAEAISWDDDDDGPPSSSSCVITSVEAAYAALHLRPSAPPAVVDASYRALARLHHPDVGGSHEGAVALNEAVALVREHQGRASRERAS